MAIIHSLFSYNQNLGLSLSHLSDKQIIMANHGFVFEKNKYVISSLFTILLAKIRYIEQKNTSISISAFIAYLCVYL